MPALPVSLSLLALGALLVWLGLHHGSSDDALLLVAPAVATYLGWPWRLRPEASLGKLPLTSWLLAPALFYLGHIFGLALLQTLALCLCLATVLRSQLPAADWQHRRGLLVLVGLSVPWVSLDFPSLGWFYRLSGATVVSQIFTSMGLPVEQQGTTLAIAGMPVNIEPACAGLHSLQAILLAGCILTWARYGTSTRSLLGVLALPLIAWLGNTARILFICAAALQTSTEAVQGGMHELLGQIVLVSTFALSWRALGEGLDRYTQSQLSCMRPHSLQRWLGLVALIYCAWNARDLLLTWRVSPYDLAGLATFIAWGFGLNHLRPSHATPSVAWLLAGLLSSALGHLASLHALGHLGLALAACAWLGAQPQRCCALCAAIAWLPATGWLIASVPAPAAAFIRIAWLLLAAMATVQVPRFRFALESDSMVRPPDNARLPWLRFRQVLLAIGLMASAALTLAHDSQPLPDAQARLDTLAHSQGSYTRVALPLAPQEAEVFGQASASKQLYTFDGESAVVLVIDGSRNRHAVHDPRYCFRGAGWQVLAEEAKPLPQGGEAVLLTLARNGETAQAIYWWSDRHSRHASALRYWWQSALRRLTSGRSGPEPLLTLIQPTLGQNLNWDHWLTAFPPIAQL